MNQEGLLCWNCGKATGVMGKPTRMDSCPHCLSDLRCCRGCRFFDPLSHFQCRETIDAPIRDKEKNNFCDYFRMRDAVKRPGGTKAKINNKDDRKKKFDDLFED